MRKDAAFFEEVINGRMKGVIDPMYPVTTEGIDTLISSGVDDITVRQRDGLLTRINRNEAMQYLMLQGWQRWAYDPCVFLRPGHTGNQKSGHTNDGT